MKKIYITIIFLLLLCGTLHGADNEMMRIFSKMRKLIKSPKNQRQIAAVAGVRGNDVADIRSIRIQRASDLIWEE